MRLADGTDDRAAGAQLCKFLPFRSYKVWRDKNHRMVQFETGQEQSDSRSEASIPTTTVFLINYSHQQL